MSVLARWSCEAFSLVVMDWRWRLCWRHEVMEVRDIGNDRGARLALALASDVIEVGGVWQWQGCSSGGNGGQ